jgi:hypothetical protein
MAEIMAELAVLAEFAELRTDAALKQPLIIRGMEFFEKVRTHLLFYLITLNLLVRNVPS